MRARSTRPPRALIILLIAVLACAGLAWSLPAAVPPAAAARGTVGEGISVPIPGYGETWLGAFETPTGADGQLSWCIQMWVSPGIGAPPLTTTVHDDPVLAWLIETYADPANQLDQAAIAYLVHQRAEVPGVVADGDVEQAKRLLTDATPAQIRDRAAAMLTVAASQAGPYQDPTPGVQSSDLRFGTITGLGVRSAAGDWVSGLGATVELLHRAPDGSLVRTDRAVIDLNGNRRADPGESAVWTGTTDGPLQLEYVATGIGDVVIQARFSGLRTTRLAYYGMDAGRQDNLSLSPTLSGEATERTGSTEVPVAHGFRVTGTSQVEQKVADPGTALCDTLDLRLAAGHTWLPVDGAAVTVPLVATLWSVGDRPVDPDEDAPEGATPVVEVRLTANEPGNYQACADPGATVSGIHTWQWRTDRSAMSAEQRDLLLDDWQDRIGIPDETSSVRHEPEVVTSLSIRATAGGLRLVDDLWAAGYPADHGDFTGDAGFAADRRDELTEFWFFPAGTPVTDEALTAGTAELIGTVTRDAVNGYQTLSGPHLAWPTTGSDADGDGVPDPRPGTVAARTLFDGDDRTGPVSTSVTDPTEQFTIQQAAPEPLAIGTAIQPDREPAPGAELVLHDTTDVTGTVPADGMTVTNELYQWPGDDPVCSPETLVAAGDPVTVTEPGRYRSQDVQVTAEPGMSYGYVETARNPAGQVLHRGACGEPSETVQIPALPTVTTIARSDSDQPIVGDELWDTLSWTGHVPTGSTATAELFHAPDGQELTCTPNTLVWTSPAIELDRSPGTADTARYRTDRPGTYGFVETTRGPDGAVLSTGICGEPAETITVGAPPTVFELAVTGTGLRVTLAAAGGMLLAGIAAVLLRRRSGGGNRAGRDGLGGHELGRGGIHRLSRSR